MAELRYGYGRNLGDYKTKSENSENFDIEIKLENGDIIEVNSRKNGYALRIKEKGKQKKELIDKDYITIQ